MVFIPISLFAVFISLVACNTPPSFEENLITSLIVKAGEPAQFECRVNGSPAPQVGWKILGSFGEPERTFPNGQTYYPGSILKFESVSKNDRGYYYCIADNGIGDFIQERFYLDIKQAPTMLRTVRTENIKSELQLTCLAEANPIAEFVWYKNNEKLSNGDKYKIDSTSWSPNSKWSGITISMKNNDYYGTYKCVMANEVGSIEEYFKVSAPQKE